MFHIRFFCKGYNFCFVVVKVHLTVPLLRVCALPVKAVPEMTYTVSDETLNSTHSLTLVKFFLVQVFRNRTQR